MASSSSNTNAAAPAVPTATEKVAVAPRPYTLNVLAGDLFTSTVIGVAVAAPVTIIDYSIMMKVSGVSPSIAQGIKQGFSTMLFKPHHFFLRNPHNQYALIYRVVSAVYILTYLTSNMVKHGMEARDFSNNDINVGRGVITGVNNTLLCMWKDSFILQRLPQAANAAPTSSCVPMLSRVGFCVRDIITCVAAFTLVPMVAEWLGSTYKGDVAPGIITNNSLSAVVVPASMQVATTVLHIGCIRYQRTYPNPSWADLSASLRADYVGSLTARVARIVPAFGIGGIGNTALLDTTTRWARDLDRKKAAAQ